MSALKVTEIPRKLKESECYNPDDQEWSLTELLLLDVLKALEKLLEKK